MSGDSVIVYAKNDASAYNNGTNPVLTAPAGTIWKAAAGESPKFSITSAFGNCDNGIPQWKNVVVLISNSTLDGFYVWGQIAPGNYSTIKNCDVSGGVGARDDFPDLYPSISLKNIFAKI